MRNYRMIPTALSSRSTTWVSSGIGIHREVTALGDRLQFKPENVSTALLSIDYQVGRMAIPRL